MATLFGFGSPKEETKGAADVEDPTSATTTSPTSPQTEDETPLTESAEAEVGAQTSCMHFMVKSKLGWIAWKEMEATLYSIFERAFGATRCEMKFSESLEDFGFEVEVPTSEVEKFQKFFKGKALAQEIDMLHGIDPTVTSRRDAKLANLKKTMGSTLQESDVRSSIEVLTSRFKALEQVGMNRDREVSAIQDQFAYLQRTMLQRFDDVTSRFQSKMEDAVWKKMQGVEKEIRDSVQEDLAVLNMNPMDKKVESAKEAASSIKPTAADDSLREHAEAADRELATVTAERDTARQQLETAEGQLKDANGHITRLTAETSKMKELEEAHAALTAQLGAVSADVADLRTQREYLRTQLAEAEAERDTLRTQMAERAAAPTVSTQGDKVEDPVKVEAQSPETDTPNPVPEETEPASLSEFIRENPNQSKAKEEPEADDPWRESQ